MLMTLSRTKTSGKKIHVNQTLRSAIAFAGMLATILAPSAGAQTQPLNDTGIIICYAPNSPCDPVQHQKQDAMIGRDVAARVAGSGLNTNTGKGFSFTKLSRIGNALADSAVLGSNPDDWACTIDNTTGLVWEIKTTSPTSSRYVGNTYTWYNPDPSQNGGNAGVENGGGCSIVGRCDTKKYIEDIQGTNLCGKANWRLPTPRQLQNLADFGSQIASKPWIVSFFPNSTANPAAATDILWTSLTDAGTSGNAWFVADSNGSVGRVAKSQARGVMAVAGP
jgi:hypothetical protein